MGIDGSWAAVAAATVAALASIITTLVTSRVAARKADDERMALADKLRAETVQAAEKFKVENESTLQRIALEQSEHAFASVRAEVERYRLEVDRLRSDNDRLTRMVDETARAHAELTGRLRQLESELMEERAGRRLAEERAADLNRLLGIKQAL